MKEVIRMGANIDYVATLAPLEIVADDEGLTLEKRFEIIVAAIKEVLKEARRS